MADDPTHPDGHNVEHVGLRRPQHYRDAWEAQEQQYRECLVALKGTYDDGRERAALERDEARATLLADAMEEARREGRAQHGVAALLGLPQGRISQLLLYHDWLGWD